MILVRKGAYAALAVLAAAVRAAPACSREAQRKEMKKYLLRLSALAVTLAAFLLVAAPAWA